MVKVNVEIPFSLLHEQDNIVQFLNGYDIATSPYDGDYTADWLLSDLTSPIWLMKTKRTVKLLKSQKVSWYKDKDYKYVDNHTWEVFLPDGTYLTDDENKYFLSNLQKLAFLIIEDPANLERMAANTRMTFLSGLTHFVEWLFLHKARFLPHIHGFSRVSPSDYEAFLLEYIKGGKFLSLACGQRVLRGMGLDINTNDDILNLTQEQCFFAVNYLKNKDLYKKGVKGLSVVDKSALCAHFKMSTSGFQNDKATAFLRQFEPEVLAFNDKVLVPSSLRTQYPGHKTRLINDVKRKPLGSKGIFKIKDLFKKGFQYEDLFPGFLSNSSRFPLYEIHRRVSRQGSPDGHHPWIPLEDTLLLLNKSIDIVINDAENIVNTFEKVIKTLAEKKWLGKYNHGHIDAHCKDDIVEFFLNPDLLDKYNIIGLSNTSFIYKESKVKDKLSLISLVELLQAACIILIAGLKPIRMEEILLLRYDCLYFKEKDGYWLQQSLVKSGICDFLPEVSKPIPKITARAIKVLKRLNDIAVKYGDKASKQESGRLLYCLNIYNGQSRGSIPTDDKIYKIIENFSDYYGTSVDEYGRRWYVNIHELRKSFLLIFFWTFKEASLDVCQWIAGHKDPDHILAYIEDNSAGNEMTELEAQYSRMQLTYFHENSSLQEVQNAEELYEMVCKHFNVTDYSHIDSDEIQDYLEMLIVEGKVNITFISVGDRNDVIKQAKVAFKITNKEAA